MYNENSLLGQLYKLQPEFMNENVFFKKVSKGETILEAGSKIPHVTFPIDSVLSVRSSNRGAPPMEVYNVGRTGAFGVLAALGHSHSDFSANVIVPGTAAFVMVGDMVKLLSESEDSRLIMLNAVRNDLRFSARRGACSSLNTAPSRIACWLDLLAALSGKSVLAITQRDIADCFSFRLATVNESLRMLKEQGWMQTGRGTICVERSQPGLNRCSCICSPSVHGNTP